jgi:hypothetical protein
MPEISRFYGIIIKMHFDDHLPPHFHAEYGEHEALIHIHTLAVIAGKLPPKALGLIVEWTAQHQEESVDRKVCNNPRFPYKKITSFI